MEWRMALVLVGAGPGLRHGCLVPPKQASVSGSLGSADAAGGAARLRLWKR